MLVFLLFVYVELMSGCIYVCVPVCRQTDRETDRDRESLVDCQDFSWYLIGKKKNG